MQKEPPAGSSKSLAPLAWSAIIFATGVLTSDLHLEYAALAALSLGMGLCVIQVVRRRPVAVLSLFVHATAFVCGFGTAHEAHHLGGNHLAHITDPLGRDDALEVSIVGKVVSFVRVDSSRTRFDVAVSRIHGLDGFLESRGVVRVTLRGSRSDVHRGVRLGLRGSLNRPTGAMNPGGFDYSGYLRRAGIRSLLYVKSAERCVILDADPDRISVLRNWFRETINRTVPVSSRPLPTALIIGDRSGLDFDTRREFAESGLMHLLAISGLHVLFVGLSVYALLKSLLLRVGLAWRHREALSTTATLIPAHLLHTHNRRYPIGIPGIGHGRRIPIEQTVLPNSELGEFARPRGSPHSDD